MRKDEFQKKIRSLRNLKVDWIKSTKNGCFNIQLFYELNFVENSNIFRYIFNKKEVNK